MCTSSYGAGLELLKKVLAFLCILNNTIASISRAQSWVKTLDFGLPEARKVPSRNVKANHLGSSGLISHNWISSSPVTKCVISFAIGSYHPLLVGNQE